ncbi:MAG: magnesium transporter [Proteobacteria bacterium]|nr:magnesium transporter [Pseudomonadota bacterium]
MTIVAARRYSGGKVVEPALDLATCGLPRRKGDFDWIGVADPTAEEMELLQRRYGLHPLAVEDALNPGQGAKAEAFGKQLFVVATTAALDGTEKIAYGQTAIFLAHNFVITVRQGSARAHTALRTHLETLPEKLAEGPDVVLHGLLDYIIDAYVPLMDALDHAVEEMEEGAVSGFPDQARIRRIFRLRRRLRRFVSIVEVASLLEQNRQGTITRQLAAWAAILGVPTAIAGIYGMNFDFMPELRWEYGYFVVLGGIIALCLGLAWRFRRIGWL